MPSSYPSSSSSSSQSESGEEQSESDDEGKKSGGKDSDKEQGQNGNEEEQSEQSQTGGDSEMESAARVFKEAKEQRESAEEDPWAESSESEEETESDWIVTGGGGEKSDEESEEQAQGGSSGAPPRDLQEEFEESLDDYDGMINEQRAVVIAKGNREAYKRELPKEKSAGVGGTSGGTESDEGKQSSSGGSVMSPGNSRIPTSLPSKNTTPGEYTHKQVEQIPADIPSGDDDDVLASQIRQAAITETDEELRGKLWEEYRRYKKAISN